MEEIELAPCGKIVLDEYKCRNCNSLFKKMDVMAQGTRRHNDGKSRYFFELLCGRCEHTTLVVIERPPMTTRGLMEELVVMYQEDDATESSHRDTPVSTSKISDDEVEKAKKILYESETFDDVLRGFGLTESDMRSVDQPPKENKENESQ